jgi:predicted O-methyltransferase YrrM
MDMLRLAHSFISYYFKAKTKYAVHSPFVFTFVTKVLNAPKKKQLSQSIENTRKNLLKNNATIDVIDFGAGRKNDLFEKRKISSIARHSAKSRKYSNLLFELVHFYKPSNILELGTSLGISAMYLASGNKDSEVYTIEGSPAISSLAAANFKNNSINNIQQYTGNFDEILGDVLKEIGTLDLVFFDGNHQKEATIKYFEQCLPYTGNDSIFIFDDIRWSKGMKEAWDNICSHSSVTCSIDLFAMGIVFFRKELSKEHFVLKY